ncbi:MAG TPA: aminotransferase class I/II-fold pyridoxal phosphate-dependent enzyme [Eudoraea sp.]|nr:aminotransferase class I/II-fold pyridoxal phosphate-dependent enzyme [Eudoraea sp.]
MERKNKGLNTICTHTGAIRDETFKGAISPLYMSTSYAFEEVPLKRYPRYFNTPNQVGLSKKIAALEHGEAALIFGSGMAAISTALMAFLNAGDHVVFQKMLYGGTYNLVTKQFEKFGIAYSFTDGLSTSDFVAKIQENTRVIYIETPSNPLLTITDLKEISKMAGENNLVTMIDNTFASPVNQNPIDFGIDVVIHSATKYMGGHSDICAGAVVSTQRYIDQIYNLAKSLGGSLSDYTVWLLERSIKTMGLRVMAQNKNAGYMAEYLSQHKDVKKVYYPGLPSHPDHALATAQMHGYGGMLSFELKSHIDPSQFQKALKLIKSSMSLAGLESTVQSPVKTSHVEMPLEEREEQGITDGLIRLSLGIEEPEDLTADIEQALKEVQRVGVTPAN